MKRVNTKTGNVQKHFKKKYSENNNEEFSRTHQKRKGENLVNYSCWSLIEDIYQEMKKHCLINLFKISCLYPLPVMLSKHVLWKIPENISRPIMAYIMITKRTRRAIWKRGIIAIRIAFMTICKPEVRVNDIVPFT